MAKGNVSRGNICNLWAEDGGLCWGVLGLTASCNFYQFKVSIFTYYFSDLIYCQSLMTQTTLQVPDWHLYFLARYRHLDSWVASWPNTSHYVSKLIHLFPQVCIAVQRWGAEALELAVYMRIPLLCVSLGLLCCQKGTRLPTTEFSEDVKVLRSIPKILV